MIHWIQKTFGIVYRFLSALCVLGGCLFPSVAQGATVRMDYRARATSARPMLMSASADGVLRQTSLQADEAPSVGEALTVGDTLSVQLFDDVDVALDIVEQTPSFEGAASFLATASGSDGLRNAVIVQTDDGLQIDVQDFANGKVYSVFSSGSGVEVREIHPTERPRTCRTMKAPSAATAAAAMAPESAALQRASTPLLASSSPKTTVDVLIVFDALAADWLKKNRCGIKDFAEVQVQKMNSALSNTGLDSSFRFKLAGARAVKGAGALGYTDGESLEAILDSAVYGGTLNGFDWSKVKSIRDEVEADVVCILTDTGYDWGTTGLGYSLQDVNDTGFSERAYNCCAIRSVYEDHTMTHEVGHNMGAGHSDRMADVSNRGPQCFSYSSGYYFSVGAANYYTIMAYNTDGYGNYYTSIPYFSSPNHTYRKIPVGDSTHNNTLTLKKTFLQTSKYRGRIVSAELGVGCDAENYTWETSINTPWSRVVDASTDGEDSVRSCEMAGETTSWMSTKVEGPALLSFDYMMRTYGGRFAVECDSTVLFERKGTSISTMPWTQVSELSILSGSHVVRFSYTHPGSSYMSGWGNGVRIDQVAFVKLFTISLDANGGSVDSRSLSRKQDSPYGDLPTPSRNGYAFEGWYTAATAGTLVMSSDLVTGNKTLYAHWRPIPYSISYLNVAVDEHDNPSSYTIEDAVALRAAARTGFRFVRWSPSDRILTGTTGPQTFTATWMTEPTVDPLSGTLPIDAAGAGAPYGELPSPPPEDAPEQWLSFVGWATDPAGWNIVSAGDVIPEGGATLHPVWRLGNLWPVDRAFSARAANVYDGWLADPDGQLSGFVRVKTAKQAIVKTINAKTRKVTKVTTNITVTATVTAPNGKKWSYKGGKARVTGVVTGLKCTTKGCPTKSFGVTLGRSNLSGKWGAYTIVGARNGTAVTGDAMKAAFPAYSGMWCTEFALDGLELKLQLTVGAKGAVKAAGTWSDGKKLSASAQLVMGDGFALVPLKAKASSTSRAFAAFVRIGADGSVAVIGRTDEAVLDSYKVARPVFDVWQESVNAMVGVAFRGRAMLTRTSYPAKLSAATALPSGLKIATSGVVSGVPTKAGSFNPKLKAVSGANKNWIAYNVQPITITALPEWARGRFTGAIEPAKGDPIAVTATVGSTGKTSGKFRTGATNWTFAASSFTTNSVTCGVTNLVCAATAKGTYKVKSGKKTVTKTVTAPLGFTLAATPEVSSLASTTRDGFFGGDALTLTRVAAVKLAVGAVKGGTVKTSTSLGQAAPGGTVKLTATPKKGYAFLGWFAPGSDTPVSQATSYSRKMAGEDVFLTAQFKKEGELAAPTLDWGAATNLTVGVSHSAKPKVTGEAAVKIVSVTGLPAGLAWKSGKASGVPTTAKTYTVSVKVALATNAKKTWTLKQRLVVGKLPAWATGTFVGGWAGTSDGEGAAATPVNQARLTVSSAGKVSGKLNDANASWTLSASSYASLADDAGTITMKAVKGTTSKTFVVTIGHDGLGGCATSTTAGYAFGARQNLWTKDETWKAWAATLAGTSFEDAVDGADSLTVAFGANGAATAKIATGAGTFSCSATLCPTELDADHVRGVLYLYFAPNTKKKFKGTIRMVVFEP